MKSVRRFCSALKRYGSGPTAVRQLILKIRKISGRQFRAACGDGGNVREMCVMLQADSPRRATFIYTVLPAGAWAERCRGI